MVLHMPSPFKHPCTGVYWYRQRVPSAIKSLAKGQKASILIADVTVTRTIGAELVVSLGTKDPKIARLLVPTVQAQFDEVWASFANSHELPIRQFISDGGRLDRLIHEDPVCVNMTATEGKRPPAILYPVASVPLLTTGFCSRP